MKSTPWETAQAGVHPCFTHKAVVPTIQVQSFALTISAVFKVLCHLPKILQAHKHTQVERSSLMLSVTSEALLVGAQGVKYVPGWGNE